MTNLIQKHNKTVRFFDYLLLIMIFLSMDNVILQSNRLFKLFIFVFSLSLFFIRKNRIDRQVYGVVLFTTINIVLQGFVWGFNVVTLFSFLVINVLMPYFALKLLTLRFLKMTSNIVLVIVLLSFVFYAIQLFMPGGTDMLLELSSLFAGVNPYPIRRPNFFLYTVSVNNLDTGLGVLRNYGAFHEPGAFAVFLSLAIGINVVQSQKMFTTKNVLMIIALITTFSTAGFISLLVMIAVYYGFVYKKRGLGVVLLMFFIPLSIYISQLPFMYEKVQEQFSEQTSKSLNEQTSGRIYGARKALLVLKRYPITGRGMIKATREEDKTSDEAAGYGFMRFFSELGVILSCFFSYYFYRGNKRIAIFLDGNRWSFLLLLLPLVINLFSQSFIGSAYFIMFFYVGLLPRFSLNLFYEK